MEEQETLSVTLPKRWSALRPGEVWLVLRTLAQYAPDVARLRCVQRLLGLRLGKTVGGEFAFYVRLSDGGNALVSLDGLTAAFEHLAWVHEPWEEPIALPAIEGIAAVDAELHGLSFGDWLSVENYYQGYLQGQDEESLRRIVYVLWPGTELAGVVPTGGECLGALLWVECMKRVFARHFSAFLQPVSDVEVGGTLDMLGVMNAQIRALTGGDVCKEEQVLAIDVWRALTELNEKAKEAQAMEGARVH